MEGGCRCGAVRFRAATLPMWVSHCHCADCRKHSGAPFTTYAGYKKEQVAFTAGEPKRYRSSAQAVRHFCGECGGPIAYEPVGERWGGEMHLFVGMFDDPNKFTPSSHVYTSEQLSFIHLDDDLPRVGDPTASPQPEPAPAEEEEDDEEDEHSLRLALPNGRSILIHSEYDDAVQLPQGMYPAVTGNYGRGPDEEPEGVGGTRLGDGTRLPPDDDDERLDWHLPNPYRAAEMMGPLGPYRGPDGGGGDEADADPEYQTADLGGWTGGSVWESGEVLARLLCSDEYRPLVEGKRVLELGCGTGVVGLTAAALGAEEVRLTDRVLFVAQHNLQTNFPEAEQRQRCRVSRLSWGDAEQIGTLIQWSQGFLSAAHVAVGLAEALRQGGGFDLIVTADTIYQGDDSIHGFGRRPDVRSTQQLLADTIAALSTPSTTVLIASPDEGEQCFAALEEHGLVVAEVSGEEVVAEAIGKVPQQSAYNRRGEVRVRRAQRRGARL